MLDACQSVAGVPPADVAARAPGAAGTNVSLPPAAYSRLELDGRGLDALVRASVHYDNVDDELDRLTAAVALWGRAEDHAAAATDRARRAARNRRTASGSNCDPASRASSASASSCGSGRPYARVAVIA